MFKPVFVMLENACINAAGDVGCKLFCYSCIKNVFII